MSTDDGDDAGIGGILHRGMPASGDACIGDACIEEPRCSDARISDARIVDARITDARISDARIADTRITAVSFHPSMDYGRGHHQSARALPEEGAPFVFTAERRATLDQIFARY